MSRQFKPKGNPLFTWLDNLTHAHLSKFANIATTEVQISDLTTTISKKNISKLNARILINEVTYSVNSTDSGQGKVPAQGDSKTWEDPEKENLTLEKGNVWQPLDTKPWKAYIVSKVSHPN